MKKYTEEEKAWKFLLIDKGNMIYHKLVSGLSEEEKESLNTVINHYFEGIPEIQFKSNPLNDFIYSPFGGYTIEQIDNLCAQLVNHGFINADNNLKFMFHPYSHEFFIDDHKLDTIWGKRQSSLMVLVDYLVTQGVTSPTANKTLSYFIKWSNGNRLDPTSFGKTRKVSIKQLDQTEIGVVLQNL